MTEYFIFAEAARFTCRSARTPFLEMLIRHDFVLNDRQSNQYRTRYFLGIESGERAFLLTHL